MKLFEESPKLDYFIYFEILFSGIYIKDQIYLIDGLYFILLGDRLQNKGMKNMLQQSIAKHRDSNVKQLLGQFS